MANKADRFRAYESIKVNRPMTDASGKSVRGDDGSVVMAQVDASGDVAETGAVPASGIVTFDAGNTKIRRVAFYSGPAAEEVCLGSVEVNKAGKITADVADIPEE